METRFKVIFTLFSFVGCEELYSGFIQDKSNKTSGGIPGLIRPLVGYVKPLEFPFRSSLLSLNGIYDSKIGKHGNVLGFRIHWWTDLCSIKLIGRIELCIIVDYFIGPFIASSVHLIVFDIRLGNEPTLKLRKVDCNTRWHDMHRDKLYIWRLKCVMGLLIPRKCDKKMLLLVCFKCHRI